MLQQLGVQRSDAPSGYFVHLYGDGNKVAGQVTLDLCGADYPSESLRIARYQVGVARTSQSTLLLSTEAVAYRNPAATSQAFAELTAAAAHCPKGYVKGDLADEPPLKTTFGRKPDIGWPTVRGVSRLAFDATISDKQGQSQESIAVYLRRGRILVGIYVFTPKSPVAIDRKTSLEGITAVFAKRLAALPTSTVN